MSTYEAKKLAMGIAVRIGAIVASSSLQSAELLAIRDLLAENVSTETLWAIDAKLTAIASEHIRRRTGGRNVQKQLEGLIALKLIPTQGSEPDE